VTDILTTHILAKLVVQYDADADQFTWTAYGFDYATVPPSIVSTGGTQSNTSTAGADIVAGIVDEWEGA